jgi:hypothetical protein
MWLQEKCSQKKPKKDEEDENAAKKKKKEDVKNCQYSSFEAAIYKLPMSSLFNIFLPLWGLALINLIIYFQ